MRFRWNTLVLLALAAACPKKSASSHCDPGSEIFCRCRGGSPGTKLCADDGASFGECRQADGACTEIPEDLSSGADTGDTTSFDEAAATGGAGASEPGGSCDHDACSEGGPLDPSCDDCAAKLCDPEVDPFCCDLVDGQAGSWDNMCVGEAEQICGLDCGGASTSSSGSGQGGATSTSATSSQASSSATGGGDCPTPLSSLFAGDLVISEIMNDPSSLSDAQGEWFEVFNPTKDCIELKGMVIESTNDQAHTIGSSVVVPAKGFAVLGANKDALAAIGVEVAYAYGTAIALSNTSDKISLKVGIKTIDTSYYDSISLKPVGASRSLDPAFFTANSNDSNIHFCIAKSFIMGASGDRGTPGKANDPCD
jgi:hypothetical protein